MATTMTWEELSQQSLTEDELQKGQIQAVEPEQGTPEEASSFDYSTMRWEEFKKQSLTPNGIRPENLPDRLKVLHGLASPEILSPDYVPPEEEAVAAQPEGEMPQEGREQQTQKPKEEGQPEEEASFLSNVIETALGEGNPFNNLIEYFWGDKEEDKLVDAEKVKHRVKYYGESLVMNTAELVDFLRNTPEDIATFWGDTPEVPGAFSWIERESAREKGLAEGVSINGHELDPKADDYATAAQQAIVAGYNAVGMKPSLETAQDIADIGLNLLAGNRSVAAGIKAISKTERLFSKADDMLPGTKKFLNDEFKYGAWGAGAGTLAASAAPGSIEDKEAVAGFVNFTSMIGKNIQESLSNIKQARDLYKKATEAGELFDERSSKLSRDIVESHLYSMVPRSMVPEVLEKMELVRRIQKDYPGYNPTNGNIIGTQEARLLQRIQDTKNPELSSQRYYDTVEAVKKMTEDLSKETDPSQRAMIAAGLRAFAGSAEEHVLRLQDQIASADNLLREIAEGDTSSVKSGKDIRKHMSTLKKQYKEAVSDLYNMVDPNDKMRFSSKGLESLITRLSSGNSPDRVVFGEDDGATLLFKTLPRYIEAMGARTETIAETGVRVKNFITLSELHNLRSMLQSRRFDIAERSPGSNVPRVLGDIVEQIDTMMDATAAKIGGPVLERYSKARQFSSEIAFPRYREGTGQDLLERDRRNKMFSIRDDEVGPMFWQPGRKGSNLEDFNRIFSDEHPELREAYPDAAKRADIVENVSAAAKDSLRQYALSTLQDALDAAPTKSPFQIIERWKVKYKQALKDFPEVQEDVTRLEHSFKAFEMQRIADTQRINELNRRFVGKYSEMDPSQLVPHFFKEGTSVEEVERLVGHMMRGAESSTASGKVGRKPINDEISNFIYPEGAPIDLSNPEVVNLQKALREAVTADMLHRSFNADLGYSSGIALKNMIHKDRNKLIKIFGSEAHVRALDDMAEALDIVGKQNAPITQPELNALKVPLKKFGISPASVLSRYYSAQLGKVGPLYLVTDGLTRLFTGLSDVYFDNVYREVMYDMDALENVLRNMDDTKMAENIEETKVFIRKAFKEGAKKLSTEAFRLLFNEHLVSLYGRSLSTDIFDYKEREEKKRYRAELLEGFLIMNDNRTGQPSRIETRLESNDFEGDDLDQFEKNDFQFMEPATEPTGSVEGETLSPKADEPETVGSVMDAVDDVYKNLIHEEGAEGDTTGAAVTGKLGVTEGARSVIPGSEDMSDKEVAKAYIERLGSMVPEDTPYSVTYSLVDTAYNAGEGVFKYPKLSKALKEGDWMGVATNFLDTATIGGKSSKGLAGRRARAYNRIAEEFGGDVIEKVFQAEDGTLSYLNEEGDVIFSFKAKNGRHPSSRVGSLRVDQGETVASTRRNQEGA